MQVSVKELVEPLLKLCTLDSMVGEFTLISLLSSMFRKLGDIDLDPSKKQELLDGADFVHELPGQLSSALQAKSQTCSTCDSGFVSALFEMLRVSLSFVEHPQVDASLVSDLALKGHSPASGIVLLESVLKKDAQNRPAWAELYRLYHALDERDVLLGLVAREGVELRGALDKEVAGQFEQAADQYKAYLQDHDTATETKHVWERYLQNLEMCQDWTSLANSAMDHMSEKGDGELWTYKNTSDLQHWALAGSRSDDADIQEEWRTFMETTDEQEVEWLKRKLPLETMGHELLQMKANFGRVHNLLMSVYDSFLHSWSSLHPLALASRKTILQPLQHFVEFEEVLEVRHRIIEAAWGQDAINEQVLGLVAQWDARLSLDSPSQLLEKVFYVRSLGLQALRADIKAHDEDGALDLGAFEEAKSSHLLKIHILSGNSATLQRMFGLAKRSFNKAMKDIKLFPDQKPGLLLSLSQYSRLDGDYSKALKFLNKVDARAQGSVEFNRLKGGVYADMCTSESTEESRDQALEALKKVKDSQGYYDMALFCFQEVKRSGSAMLAQSFMESVLDGISLGSKGCLSLFPHVLGMLKTYELGPQLSAKFRTGDYSTHALMDWVPQMFALLVEAYEGPFILTILERMAKKQPDSLRATYNIVKDRVLEANTASPEMYSRLEAFARSISNPMFDDFLWALGALMDPLVSLVTFHVKVVICILLLYSYYSIV